MKKQYTNPQLYIENVVVESGIAASLDYTWGDVGYAGQRGVVNEYDGDDL